MKKRSSLFMLMVMCLAIFALSACGGKKGNEPAATEQPEDTIVIGSNTSEPDNQGDIETQGEDYPEVAEGETPEGYVRSRVTNLWIPEDMENVRPIAYMCPDDPSALPHYSISKAGVVYEVPVEGSISRLLCVIDDWSNLERIGNVRSARHYYVPLAYEWDAFLVHFGNPFYADDILAAEHTNNINGSAGVTPASTFFRTKDRSAPQNAYTSTEGVEAAISKLGYSRTYTSDRFMSGQHFVFATESAPNLLDAYSNAKKADKVNLSGIYPVDKPYFEYNAEDGLYYRFQYNSPHVDAAFDKVQLSFSNIIVQKAVVTKLDPNGYLDVATVGSGSGYFITRGKAIEIQWKKENNFADTKYFDGKGKEIVFNTGKTMICIVSNDSKEPVFE